MHPARATTNKELRPVRLLIGFCVLEEGVFEEVLSSNQTIITTKLQYFS
jgi:hypothetical protein